jgi:hypothetical protein
VSLLMLAIAHTCAFVNSVCTAAAKPTETLLSSHHDANLLSDWTALLTEKMTQH